MTVCADNWPIAATQPVPLTTQIVDFCSDSIRRQLWPAGARLPSIRALAERYPVSRFTVAEAYERLVARGLIQARHGAGYFVAGQRSTPHGHEAHPADSALAQEVELMRLNLSGQRRWQPGVGCLPAAWLADGPLAAEWRALSQAAPRLVGYGSPQGYLPLREALVQKLEAQGLTLSPAQLVTTSSATHALDLILRLVTTPGDTVLVDDPGFYNFHAALRLARVNVVGIPRTPHGPDTERLAEALRQHRPRLFLTVSALHNPTGSTLTLPVAHQVLKLLEQWNCLAVEDDIYADFEARPGVRLAALDGLSRVIYLASFTKTLSANLRCGYIAADPGRIAGLTDIKLISGMTTPEAVETLVYRLLTGGRYRRHVDGLRKRLEPLRADAIARLKALGFTLWHEPAEGFLLWAEAPPGLDLDAWVERARAASLLLAPGRYFSPAGAPSRHLRFNVAQCGEAGLWQVMGDTLHG
ncbi:transcriptional regulator, GntR family with aminotransferase domain [Pseudogulbenkiania sp. NH8B]|uniref:aminotransferase-like domain-containing protein n=1 Tax=Pseudogulbenkiania sp. (strain NH8B) TaxID=748280 RepID=UPI000227918A|nr:PLP-dependent aminotransferase family protein [Pseudogulbenkiania sp. NH8B]BAK75701.1 transcriptional regulator, GntR family with aminotransferase domain [Pseudogulbenkiania sp. NH8B]